MDEKDNTVEGVEIPEETPTEVTKTLVPHSTEIANQAVVMPAITAQQFKEAWNAYEELKKVLLTPADVQMIGTTPFKKKSYWKKVATAFNLNVTVVSENKEVLPDGDVLYNFVCRATAPNGRYAEGTGTCNKMEKGRDNSYHNARSTAETRAANRAISNLVGGGEISAEEADQEYQPYNRPSYSKYPAKKPATPQPAMINGRPTKGDPNAFNEYKAQIDQLPDPKGGKLVITALQQDKRLSASQVQLLTRLVNEKINTFPADVPETETDEQPF